MIWIVGGNYANGLYAGLSYADKVQMSMAKNIELAFAYANIGHSSEEQHKATDPSDTSQEDASYDLPQP